MSNPDYLTFKGVAQIGDLLLTDQLEGNLLNYLNWAFLNIGGFANVTLPASGAYGGSQSRLRPVEDPNYIDGQVWEGFRKDWVWESGIDYATQPIRVSGVYVGSGFQPLAGSGAYAHHVDYPLGRVVFDTPIAASSVVSCEFSPRSFQIYQADTPWWQQVQPDSYRVDDPQFLQPASGGWSVLGQNRIQLPAIVVEAELSTERYGLEIGSLEQVVTQNVNLHVLAETRPDLKVVHDILTGQQEKAIQGFDMNGVMNADGFPLDDQGSPVGGARMYPDLVSGYPWRQLRVKGARSKSQPRMGPLFYTKVVWATEVFVP